MITDIEPVWEVVSEFFLMEFYFLSDVEFFSEFDEDAIDGIVVVRIVSAGGCEVENDEVIISAGLDKLLVVLKPLD